MNMKSMQMRTASLAIAMLSLAAPALAQDPPPVTFENFRDAVPGRFNPSPGPIVVDGNTTTLHIDLEDGANAFKACAPSTPPLSAAPCSITRVAMDTLGFVVRAPEDYYVSKITYVQAGTGAIFGLADARGGSSFVVAGEPVDLGAVHIPEDGGSWSLSRAKEFTDTNMTAVPVSLTTGLFAYAGPDLGSARVELKSASVAVEIKLIVDTPSKKTATIVVEGDTVTYDGREHGAKTVTAIVDGTDVSHRLEFDIPFAFTNVPGGTVRWVFPGDETYNRDEGTAEIVINPADATIVVTALPVTYDGQPHGATGTATGVDGIDLNANLTLGGETYINAPGGLATWTFGGDPNYHDDSGSVVVTINRATPVLTWPQPAAIAAGTALSTTQLNATAAGVAGAFVAGTFAYTPPLGTVLAAGTHSLSVTFTPAEAELNYTVASASVNITVNAAANSDLRIVNPGPQSDRVGDKVRLQIRVNAGVSSNSGDDDDDRRNRGGRLKGEYSATGLPAGLFIEDDGEIRGTLTTAGTHRTVVTFTPRRGAAVSTAFDWTVLPRSSTNHRGKG